MQEIKCPNCQKVFQVDESGYAQIVSQVRDSEFKKELARRENELAAKKESELETALLKQERERESELSKKQTELEKKEREISELKAKLGAFETEKRLAVSEAVAEKEKLISKKQTELAELRGELNVCKSENENEKKALREKYEDELKDKDKEIEYYKDFKARQSTKMVGESLEQHCLNQFNSLRMSAFPTAYFEKDNDARTGSKGDFIFRESSDGVEFISIMFEMKNEMDTTATKHKNEDFFKELDKDRREKGCEYAVLVSLLEIDNEYYNNGIVDVSYRYPKMYVIRPQFFIPMITLLRNAARNSLEYRKELALVQSRQLDIGNFEENIKTFKEGFAKNYELASRKFGEAIDEIDKSISHLQKIKAALQSSERNLRLANNKVDDLSIKKLTKNAPGVRQMFDSLKEREKSGEDGE